MQLKVRSLMVAAVVSALGLSNSAYAQPVPGPHPRYLHALSDLRAARHYLHDGWAWEPVRREDNIAIVQIDKAINEIKAASIDDGKGLNDPFSIDAGLSPHNRFRKAKELLRAALDDVNRAEDVPESRVHRSHAIDYIEHAFNTVDQAERTAHWE